MNEVPVRDIFLPALDIGPQESQGHLGFVSALRWAVDLEGTEGSGITTIGFVVGFLSGTICCLCMFCLWKCCWRCRRGQRIAAADDEESFVMSWTAPPRGSDLTLVQPSVPAPAPAPMQQPRRRRTEAVLEVLHDTVPEEQLVAHFQDLLESLLDIPAMTAAREAPAVARPPELGRAPQPARPAAARQERVAPPVPPAPPAPPRAHELPPPRPQRGQQAVAAVRAAEPRPNQQQRRQRSIEPTDTFDCPICMETKRYEDVLLPHPPSTRCKLCRDCGRAAILAALDQAQIPPACCICVASAAGSGNRRRAAPFDEASIASVLTEEEQQRWRRRELEMWRDTSGTARPCPTANCNGIGVVEGRGDLRCRCPICNVDWCSRCGRVHEEGTSCEEHQRWLEENGQADARFADFVQAQQVKRCPSCAHAVLKSEGCNHMTCRCGHHFCYSCNRSLDEAHPYAHFRGRRACRLFDGQDQDDVFGG